MKTLSLQILTIAFFSMLFTKSEAQDKYRVIAIKKRDTSVISISNEVAVSTPIKLWIPSAFTPNNDGINDAFGASGIGIENYKMEIYNRWGELLFESNDLQKQWNGWHKGNPATIGEYVYSISATGSSGKKRETINKTGLLHLLK